MSRGLSTGLQTALQQQIIRAGYMVHLETTGGNVYLSTRPYDFDYFSVTWQGNSWLRPTFSLTESVRFKANGLAIKLAGLDPTAISLVLSTLNHSKKGRVWLFAFNEGGSIIADPYQVGEGFFDSADVRDSGANADITINYENEFVRSSDASQFRMTHFSQQARFPGDMGFQYTSQVEDWSGFWGRAARPNFSKKRKTKN